jgi:hypothetical protein
LKAGPSWRLTIGTVSIKSTAVELVERIFGNDFARRSIVIIGAGQMANAAFGEGSMLSTNGIIELISSARPPGPRLLPGQNNCSHASSQTGQIFF